LGREPGPKITRKMRPIITISWGPTPNIVQNITRERAAYKRRQLAGLGNVYTQHMILYAKDRL
jgi:hypothetical protein